MLLPLKFQASKKPNGAPSQSAADKKTPSAATAQRTPSSKSTPCKPSSLYMY